MDDIVKRAIDFMLHQEDDDMCGEITDVKNDHGGMTRFGLTARWHPALVEAGFFSPKMPRDQALALAEVTYQEEYAKPLRLTDLSSDAVACGMISFAVLDGIGSCIRLLRAALYTCGYNIPINLAVLDRATFSAELDCDEKKLVPALVSQQKIRCEHIAADDPSQSKFLKGWENRADQVLALVK
jgi:lysozyme family protein